MNMAWLLHDDLLNLAIGIFDSNRFGLADRERNGDSSAALGRTVDLNLAIMTLHISLADAQSQARPLSALGGEEGLKDVRQYLRLNACSGIHDADLDGIVGGRAIRKDGNAPSFRCGLRRVQQQIHDHL